MSMCRADALLVEARVVRKLDDEGERRVVFWRQGRPQSLAVSDLRSERLLDGPLLIGVYAPGVELGRIAEDIVASALEQEGGQ